MWPYLAKVLDSAPMAMVPIILFLAFSSTAPSISAFGLPPVILVPGFGCSQLKSTVSADYSSPFMQCSIMKLVAKILTLNSWMSPAMFIPLLDRCSVDLLLLNYNNMTRKTTNLPGIETKVAGFGDPISTENTVTFYTRLGRFILRMLPSLANKLRYFADIADRLVLIGYERNKSLRAAPYDFRRGPNESQEYFKNLKNLVEETYRMNGNRKIVFLAHSYGGPMTLSFLKKQTKQWKDKYIRSMISLSAVFGGTMKTIQQVVTGDYVERNYNFSGYASDTKKVIRTWPSVAFMMPNRKLWRNRVLVRGPHKNYTASNIHEFFEDLGEPNISEMFTDQQPDVPLEPPDVEYHCFYSTTNKPETPQMLTYEPGNYPGNPGILNGTGDLMVNERSLEYCKKWTNRRGPKVHVKKFQGLNHTEILRDKRVLKKIQNILEDYASEDVITKR